MDGEMVLRRLPMLLVLLMLAAAGSGATAVVAHAQQTAYDPTSGNGAYDDADAYGHADDTSPYDTGAYDDGSGDLALPGDMPATIQLPATTTPAPGATTPTVPGSTLPTIAITKTIP